MPVSCHRGYESTCFDCSSFDDCYEEFLASESYEEIREEEEEE
jgi:hypothetical protein